VPDGVASFLVKQGVGLNEPLNDRGEEVIECLLGINRFEGNGRRILIDIKHMSVASRKQYYEMVSSFNSGKSDEEKIPIVASHCGYSGHRTLSDSIIVPDTEKSKYENSETFNPWSVNLSDEDVVEIFNSGGLIGINLDQRILSGMDVIEDSKDFSNREVRKNSEQVVRFWTEQIALNILGMVKAVVNSDVVSNEDKVKVWDIISIGSDFDGMINPVDSFITAEEFKDMRSSLKKYMPQMAEFNICSLGLTVDEILDRVMYDNAVDFVIKNYR
jgi:microsomal dipeptidase-like Zn-dependent dipeptidase